MCRFIETIRIDQGKPQNLKYHQERVDRTISHFFGAAAAVLPLYEAIRAHPVPKTGAVKCRVTYGKQVEKIEFEQYLPHPVNSLKVVHADDLDYSFKYADRSRLHQLLEQKGRCDDVLIIKNGLVADTSYCNIIFDDGKKWVTPATPLLEGTCRRRLLDNGLITASPITINDLGKFSRFMLINAMLDFDKRRWVGVGGIVME
jgi:4-amino-4-deoxychorismate lyase